MNKEVRTVVYDEELPLRIIANTAAVMGITLGKAMPEVVGADVRDESGHTHLGIIEFPVPILRRCRRACCSISALPSAAQRRRSTSSQAVSRSCGEPKKYLKITLDK